MKHPTGVRRREILALGAAAAGGLAAGARGNAAERSRSGGEFLVRGGQVVSVDPTIGELPRGDVHIRDGVIVAVRDGISAPGATVIDARGQIVMPGFVDTHWHMWTGTWRGMAADAADYFRYLGTMGQHYTVDDHYKSVLYAALEGINAGITSCHNWAHGVRNFADLEAEMKALADSGLRARMGYVGVTRSGPTSAADFRRALDWIATNGQGRLSLSILLDGAAGDQFAASVRLARELGLKTISSHGNLFAAPDLVGPEFLVTHGVGLTPEQIRIIAQRGVKVGLCPGTDTLSGAGLPPVQALLAGGVPLSNISFTVDSTAQTPADPFESLRILVAAGRMQQAAGSGDARPGRESPKWLLGYRQAIELGTLSGANVLGIADQTGSLTPGKRADVILVRKDDINMLPAANTDPTMQLVQHAQPSNVDTVFIDGRIRKRAGRLVGVDVRKVVADAAAVQDSVRQRAGAAAPR
jgi:cytosine/adenosine deaminase-related metal-dependent hydrolase